MKLSQALREVARLHAEEPGHHAFSEGICKALEDIKVPCRPFIDLMDELGESILTILRGYDLYGLWTARPWMCLILAEYLEGLDR